MISLKISRPGLGSMIFHSDLPWISDTQDGGGDILQDGPPEEEEPGDGKARIGRR